MNATVGFVAGSCTTDCHVHVFEPDRFPYAASRRYTPPAATVDDLLAVHMRLGVQRAVLVQPSVYGTDNRCLLAALDRLGGQARGVAVIGDQHDAAQLASMHARGVRAARLNLHVAHQTDPAAIRSRILRLSEQLTDRSWIIQIYASLAALTTVATTLAGLPQRVLIDHFGMAQASRGTQQAGFRELLDLVGQPNIHIKLSGPYQISERAPGYDDVASIARSLFAAAPGRSVWGSDWPHPGGARRALDAKPTDIEPFRDEDDARNVGLVGDWLPDVEQRHQLLVKNPASLFGFGDPPNQTEGTA
jgi:2-pyrone-4,6-dicarboxylate lactonase